MSTFTAERLSAADAIVARLRPRKIRSALRRRWFEWRMPRRPLAPMPGLRSLGTDYGGYVVPVERIGSDWVCYCVGTGADVSFELELIESRGVEVRSFEAVENLANYVREQARGEPRLS